MKIEKLPNCFVIKISEYTIMHEKVRLDNGVLAPGRTQRLLAIITAKLQDDGYLINSWHDIDCCYHTFKFLHVLTTEEDKKICPAMNVDDVARFLEIIKEQEGGK